ncbi:hypothetical protein D3C75_1296030 [compost metagenome]
MRRNLGTLDILLNVLYAAIQPWAPDDDAGFAFREIGERIPGPLSSQFLVQIAFGIPVAKLGECFLVAVGH